jgi:putative tricarboxylic transport membrane protein
MAFCGLEIFRVSRDPSGSIDTPLFSGRDTSPVDTPPIDIFTPTLRGDVIAAALCLGFGLAGYFLIIPNAVYVPPAFVGTANSPAFLPKMVCMILAGLSTVYLIKSVIALRRESSQGRAPIADWALAGAMALICIVYVVAIMLVGLTIASAACVAGAIVFFGERRLSIIVPIAIIGPAVLWYFFVKIANILLPIPFLELLAESGL